jgi:signal transduction histidine kinase
MRLRRPLRIRTRVALWCAVLATASGALVLLGVLLLTQHTLDQHAPRPALSGYSTDPVVLRSQQFAAVETNRILVQDTTGHVRDIGLIGLAGLAVVSLAVGWFVSGRMLAPAARLAATARQITAADLDTRVNATGPDDELRVLADAFDSMLDRLDRSFARQRRFVADASHELRTPFAAMRAQVDVALEQNLNQDQLRETLIDIGKVLDRGSALVNAMLALSRAETLARREPVELSSLTAEILTATPGIDTLELRTELAPAQITGDPVLLEQLVQNLLRNAVAYNKPHGRIDVQVSTKPDTVELRVANDGAPIRAEDVPDLTARFHRGTGSGRAPGFGLGLSVVSTIAAAHHADLHVTARLAGGLDITVRFPS